MLPRRAAAKGVDGGCGSMALYACKGGLMSLKHVGQLACIVLQALVAATAQAQGSFPSKPIRIIVGFAAGGGNDIIVRVLAPKMSEGLGQPIIVENKPGAQSIIAAEYVAKSAPDGYRLFMGPSGAMPMNPAIYSKLPYSPLRDFAPISMIGDFPLILVVNASLPVNSVKDLIDYAKARPNDVNYSASAAPFQLAAELFNQKTGTRFAHIPYKSSGDSVGAVMSGQVTTTITAPPPVLGPLKGRNVKGLPVTSAIGDPARPGARGRLWARPCTLPRRGGFANRSGGGGPGPGSSMKRSEWPRPPEMGPRPRAGSFC